MNHADGDYGPVMKRAPESYVLWLKAYHKSILNRNYPYSERIMEKLLKISGGDDVILSGGPNRHTIDYKELLKKGSIRSYESEWTPKISQMCYHNSICLSKHIGGKVVVGYAWRDDEREWRAHAWVERDKKIIETTTPRDLYFGYVIK